MYKKLMDELVGKKINHLTIIEARPNKLKGMVKVVCECGKEFITRGRSVKTGNTKSCGCKRSLYTKRGQRIKGNNPAFNSTYSVYRTRSERKGMEFDFTEDEFFKKTQECCYYCGLPPENKTIKHNYEYIYSGLDRVDNSIGYTKENTVPCCYICNTKKASITKEMVKLIYDFIYGEKTDV